jgi:hypothetical protein
MVGQLPAAGHRQLHWLRRRLSRLLLRQAAL